jgi:hypothetical protein
MIPCHTFTVVTFYDQKGIEFRFTSVVGWTTKRPLVGTEVPVRYVPSDPRIAYVGTILHMYDVGFEVIGQTLGYWLLACASLGFRDVDNEPLRVDRWRDYLRGPRKCALMDLPCHIPASRINKPVAARKKSTAGVFGEPKIMTLPRNTPSGTVSVITCKLTR